jgi:hypothetical protein
MIEWAFGLSKGFLDSISFTRGCRPFSTDKEPLALYPGVPNPGMTAFCAFFNALVGMTHVIVE